MKGQHKKNYFRRHWQLYAMFVPAAILLLIFNYVPMYGTVLAFKEFSPRAGILGSEWIGLENFRTLFSNSYFFTVLGNTLKISLLKFIAGFPVPLILALMMNEVRSSKFKRTVQTVSYLPYFISWVVVAGILINLCSIEGGIINRIIEFFGGNAINFFGNGKAFVGLLVVSDIWKGAGWGTIIYFAALSGIDPAIYEASMIDGANRWQRIRYIIMPALVPAISINLILTCQSFMSAGFDQIFNLYNRTVYKNADIIDTYIYRIGITDGKYEISTALGLFNSVVTITLILVTNKLIKKMGGRGLW